MGGRFIAMLALERPAAVTEQALTEQMARQYPGHGVSVTGPPAKQQVADGPAPLLLRMLDTVVTVIWIDQPIPADSLAPAVAACQAWPKARERMAAHRAHAIVATVTEAKDWKAAVDGAVGVTLVTGALAAILPCIGVYWSTGMTVTESSQFQAEAQRMVGGPMPLDLWMQVNVAEGPAKATGEKTNCLLSFGLTPFFDREIEFSPSTLPSREIAAHGFRAVLHMLANGPVPDGGVIETGSAEEIRARYAPRGWRSEHPVIELTVERAAVWTPPAGKPAASAPVGTQHQAAPCKFMGILAVAKAVDLDAREIAGRMGHRFPSYKGPPIEAMEVSPDGNADRERCQLRIGDMVANFSVIAQPIYPTILEAAVRAATGWPDAGRYLSGHRAQIIVELVSPSGGSVAGRIDAAKTATMLCAASADLAPALAIYWKNGGTITETGQFQELAGVLASGEMPMEIWTQIVRQKGSAYVASTGLRDFLGREMEFAAVGLPEDEARRQGFAVCRQLLAHGDNLRDDEPVPLDGERNIVPHALLEGQREDIPVWSLTIEERPESGDAPGSDAMRAPPSAETPPPPTADAGSGAIEMPRGRPGGEESTPGSFMTILALEQPAAVGEADFMDRMRQQFPQLQSKITSASQQKENPAPDAPMVFVMGDCMMTVMFVDRPVPPGTFAVAAGANRTWPGVERDLAAHRAHVLVHAKSNSGGWNGALNSARNLTVVSAVLAGMLPAIGVYWSQGWVVSKPAEFIDGAGGMLAGNYPAHLWIQFWFLSGPRTERGEPTNAILTTGLEPFFGREIEFLPAAIPDITMLHRLLGTIQYLLTSGPVLEHGNSLGVSADEHIRVRHADQGQRPGIPVYQFTLEALDEDVAPFRSDAPPPPASTDGGSNKPADRAGNDFEGFAAMIALERPASVSEAEFLERLQARFPEYHARVTSRWEKADVSAFGERFMFDMDGHRVGVMFIHQPMPPEMLEPALRSSLSWPEAQSELARHQANVTVHADPGGRDWKDAVACARVVTVTGAVLAELLPAIGVNWCEGVTVSKAAEFVESADKVVAGKYTDANWFRHWVSTDPDLPEPERMIAMGTIGLKSFFGREIEFVPARVPPAIMAQRMLGVIQYLLTNGPVLDDGGTLGVSQSERIRVRHVAEGKLPGVPAYQLTLEALDEAAAPPQPASPPPPENPTESPRPEGQDRPRKPLFGRRGQD